MGFPNDTTIRSIMILELDPFDEHSHAWRAGYEEGVKRALQQISYNPTGEDVGVNICRVELLLYALRDLPPKTEVLDPYGVPLRGEIADNYSYGKSLFVYGRRLRPPTLGEPF